jgi:soluble lytic murein transglycosylase-like protein
MVRVVLLVLLMMTMPLSGMAAIYTYVNGDGVPIFTNIKPPGKKACHVVIGGGGSVEPRFTTGAVYNKNTYDHLIKRHSEANGLDYRLVKAVMIAESNGNPMAVSQKGAQGLMQIMPETGHDLALRDPFDPEENIQAGAKYLRLLHNLFKGDIELVLAAYNAGPQKVMQSMAVPPISETINYIKRVKLFYARLKESQ